MTATVSPAAEFVERLLAASDDDERQWLLDQIVLQPAETHAVVLRLVDEAERLLGVALARAEELCAVARALGEAAGEPYLCALIAMRHADVLRARGLNTEACAEYQSAVTSFEGQDRPIEAARARGGWMLAAARLGHVRQALRAGRRAYRELLRSGEIRRAATVSMSLGNLHYDTGAYSAAVRCHTRSLGLLRTIGPAGELNTAQALVNRGMALLALGHRERGLVDLNAAIRMHRSLGQEVSHARASAAIGSLQMEVGDYSAALRSLEAAASLYDREGVSRNAALARNWIAECFLRLGRPEDALEAAVAAGEALRGTDLPLDAVAAAARQAAALLALGREAEAISVLDDAERRTGTSALQDRAWLGLQRAAILLRSERWPEALAAAQVAETFARRIGSRQLLAFALVLRATALLALSNVDAAESAAAEARRLAATLGAPPLLHRAAELLGRIAEARGDLRLARRRYAAAIRQLERERAGVIFDFRAGFATDRMLAYERLAALQVRGAQPERALLTAERAKSRALLEAIGGAIELRPRGAEARGLGGQLAQERERYAAAHASAHGSTGDHLAIRDVEGGGNSQSGERRIADLTRGIQLAEAGRLRRAQMPPPAIPAMPPDTRLVEYFFSGRDILRFTVSGRRVRAACLGGAVEEVDRLVRALRLNFTAAAQAGEVRGDGLTRQAKAVLQRLYRLLLGEVDVGQETRSLVIVPHGFLHSLPFHALHDGERYLIERCAVTYAPSAALYELLHQRPAEPSGGALVLGCSAGGRLPAAVDEARMAAAMLESRPLLESAATRSALRRRARRASVIHIAAHGGFRDDAPLFSHVELADGPLTTADVFALHLNARLVTLSACDSGISRLGAGDELAGLSQAFLYAGARCLLASQWRLEDDAAARLMRVFYGWLRSGIGAGVSLRRAQIERLRADVSQHPFYWAGFQIIGDGGGR